MPYLIELILFALPFGAYALWRRLNPDVEPGSGILAAAAAGLVLALAGALWFGRSGSSDRNVVYVPAHIEGDRIAPPHTEPRR